MSAYDEHGNEYPMAHVDQRRLKQRHATTEPTAEQRTLAKNIVGLFVALVQEGMSADEALTFLARWAGSSGSGDDE